MSRIEILRSRLTARTGVLVVVAAYCAAITTALFGLRSGVDLQDEAYYLAFGYRFAQGDIPLVDELSLHQLPGILLSPFVRAYTAAVGSTDGIVLAGRMLYLVVLLLVLAGVYHCLRPAIGRFWSALVCLPMVFYAPMSISGLGVLPGHVVDTGHP